MDTKQILIKMALLLVLGGASVLGVSGCGPKLVISNSLDPVWMEQDQPTPFEGWLVTQGKMQEMIEATR
ncbi:MAG TPA: hypothetical protein ENH62_15065 [Marinobacter sp.]|nr:hypothetical protein [Marinobacter sp.]